MSEKDEVIVAILTMLISSVVSWLGTCILIKLLSVCFGFVFTLKLATGIWIVILMLRSIFKVTVKKD